MKHRGVRLHRIRDFKQYWFNSIPPTSQAGSGMSWPCGDCVGPVDPRPRGEEGNNKEEDKGSGLP